MLTKLIVNAVPRHVAQPVNTNVHFIYSLNICSSSFFSAFQSWYVYERFIRWIQK